MYLAEILEALTPKKPSWQGPEVLSAVHDSRQAIDQSLFVALKGERVDGHDYVTEAFARGAILAIVERDPGNEISTLDLRSGVKIPEQEPNTPLCLKVKSSLEALQMIARYWRGQLDLRVIGVTGSVGKTTSKELIAEVLNQRYRTFKSVGNYNNEIGLPLNMVAIKRSDERAVLEMGFYVPGEIAFLADIAQPQVGVVTNIGTVHAERAGSQQAIYEGKAELIRSLPSDGTAVLNFDDPLVKRMADESPAPVFSYGLESSADLWADEVEGLGLDGIRFRLHYKSEKLKVRVPMIGRHSVHTALRAAAVGLVEGLDWQFILQGLRIGHPQLRLVAAEGKDGSILLDDTYNASPESTMAALNLLSELEGRKVAVLGDMLELGQYESQGHRMVGNLAAKVADILVTIGKRAEMIAESALESGLSDSAILQFTTSDQALKFLKSEITGRDVVLVKGSRAMHMDNIVPELEMQ